MKITSARNHSRRRTRRGRTATVLALAFTLSVGLVLSPFACWRVDDGVRGQSGSEGPAGTGGSASDESPPCPCGAAGVFLRVTLLGTVSTAPDAAAPSSDAPLLRMVRVDSVIHGETALAAGDELQVEDYGQLPCFIGAATVGDGQSALAVFTPADAPSCDASACGIAGSVRLAPWADELLFADVDGARLTVPASELDSLWSGSVDACIERHGDVWEQSRPSPSPTGLRP